MSAPTPARRIAFEVLRRVFEHGAWANRALRSTAERAGLDGRDRGHAQRLAYGAVQRRGSSDHVIAELSGRELRRIEPPLLAALRLGLYELLFEPDPAPHAAIDQAVELAKRPGGRRSRRDRGAGLVNALLRRADREREQILGAMSDEDPAGAAVAHSLPPWIAELWWRELGGSRARALMRSLNRPPERSFRLTGGTGGPGEPAEATLERLQAAGVRLTRGDGGGPLRCDAVVVVEDGPWEPIAAAIERGELVPQSRASAAAAALLDPQPGERVLDLCAAPGMKTTQIAAAVGPSGAVTAVEADAGRARELGELCARVGAGNVEIVVGDARTADVGAHYDRVLVDAPCSGLGTLASRPDSRWRRGPADVEQMAELGAELLDRAAGAVRPGGRILHSLCTISRREGAGLVAARATADARIEVTDLGVRHPQLADPADRRFLQSFPDRDPTDGFFFAALERRA